MKVVWLLPVLLPALTWAQYTNMECPFPEGPGVNSDVECDRYRACVWAASEGQCYMKSNDEAGYVTMGDPVTTPSGFKVNLEKRDIDVTLFDGDISQLVFEVINHEDYHVQVKIYDPTNQRYEVPVPLSLPGLPGGNPQYTVDVSAANNPFSFSIKRAGNGKELFNLWGPLSFEDQFLQFATVLPSTYLYGLGENTHPGFRHMFSPTQTYPLWARDQPVGEGYLCEYGVHPYYVVVDPDTGDTHSVLFFNSNAMEYSTFLLSDGRPAISFRSIGGILDLHFFTGPTLEDINKQYTTMVGYPAFPPYYTLGFHLSKYGYVSTDEVREVRARMKAMGIPQDVQTVDIDYMLRFRDFTYDPGPWGDLPDLTVELHNDDLKLTIILDPAVVIDWANYPPGQRGKDADAYVKWYSSEYIPDDQDPTAQDYMIGYVWPDTKTVFPDFFKAETKAWWSGELQIFHDSVAFDAIWIDMNEPANFGTNLDRPWNYPDGLPDWSLKCPYNHWDNPPFPTKAIRVGDNQSGRLSDHSICLTGKHTDGTSTFMHYDVHSLYGWSETVATFEGLEQLFPGKRPVVLSRSTYPSSGKYAVHWLGDNTSAWSHLKYSIIGMLEFNLFGLPMVGADICGFFGDSSVELCARWMELGAFYPFSRNHNAIGQIDQDPAIWPEVAAISSNYLNLRYRYIPYLYFLFHDAHMHGNSVVRPVWSEYPTDSTALDVDDQFMWGTGIMVAPVITQGAVSRSVYFPQGLWYNLETGALVASGPTTQTISAPMEVLPVYARGGIILPFQEPALNTVQSRQNPFGLTVPLDGSGGATGGIYWDDGVSEHAMSDAYTASVSFAAGTLNLQVTGNAAAVSGLNLETVQFFGYSSNPSSVTVNGVALDPSGWAYNSDNVLTVWMSVPLGQDVTVQLG